MKLKTTTLATLLATSLLASPVMANDSWQGEAKDAWLAGKLETALLLNTELNSFTIDTDINEGSVVLSGKVRNQTQKDLAGEIAENIDGVTQVTNNLTIDEKHQQPSTDNEKSFSRTWHDITVTAGLKMELAAHETLEASAINVSTDNGVVTLQGTVKNAAEHDLAIEMAKGYDKVVEVKDELVIAN